MNEMRPKLSKHHNEGYIAVRGTSRIASPSDKVTFSVGVTIKKGTVSDAFEANTNQIKAVMEALSEAGVPDNAVETSYFNLDWIEARKNVSAGFQVTNRVRVTREATDNIGKLLAVAVDAGATNIGSIHFFVEDSSDLENRGLRQAFEDARKKAETLAALSNRTLGRVLSVTTADTSVIPHLDSSNFLGIGANSSPQIMPRENESVISVDAVFELE